MHEVCVTTSASTARHGQGLGVLCGYFYMLGAMHNAGTQ